MYLEVTRHAHTHTQLHKFMALNTLAFMRQDRIGDQCLVEAYSVHKDALSKGSVPLDGLIDELACVLGGRDRATKYQPLIQRLIEEDEAMFR